MKKLLLFLVCAFFPSLVFAQAATNFIRNDNAATVLQGTNLNPVPASADSHGIGWVNPATRVANWDSASLAFGSITNSFTTILANGSAHRYVICLLNNQTNGVLSWDNGSQEISSGQPASDRTFFDLGANGILVNTAIRVKYLSAPSSGTAYINCGY